MKRCCPHIRYILQYAQYSGLFCYYDISVVKNAVVGVHILYAKSMLMLLFMTSLTSCFSSRFCSG